jgi:hypothetical protein
MRKEDLYRLRDLYPHLWSYQLLTLPDGWLGLTERLLADLNAIQPTIPGVYGSPLLLWIKAGSGFAVAFVSPSAELGTWDRDKAMALIEAVQRFNGTASDTCEVCGEPSVVIMKEADGSRQQTLCQLHADARMEATDGQ